MKRTLAFLMAMVLVLALATMAFGDQLIGTESATTGTVTITNATVGETYQGYRIFNATVARTEGGNASDLTDDGSTSISYTWAGTGTMPTNAYFEADTSGNITATTAAGSGTNMTPEAIELIKSWIGTNNSTYSFPSTSPVEATDTTMKFAGLDYGYWYFTSSLGTIVTINSTNPNVSVTDKNTKPTIEKFVEEDATSTYGKQNDAEYGQTVKFQTIIYAKKGAQNYVLYDQLASGFTFDGITSIHVFQNGAGTETEIPATETVSGNTVTNWTAAEGGTYPSDPTGTASFTVTFNQDYLNRMEDTSHIIVRYTATLNNTAVVNTAIANSAILTYGASNSKTAESQTHTYVWGAKIVKYTGTDAASGTKLAGAEFVIAKHVTDGETKHAFATFDSDGKFTGWTSAVSESALPEASLPTKTSAEMEFYGATVLTTNSSGEINVTGLDAGSYHVIETKAPAGYNKLTSAVPLTVTSTSDTVDAAKLTTAVVCSSGTNGITEVDVQNNAGSELPSTGGIGTTLFYIIGGLLAVGAIVVLIVRKRMD